MQLCKILQSNTAMMPPMFADLDAWMALRKWLNTNIYLETIVSSKAYIVVELIVIVLCFLNGALILAL